MISATTISKTDLARHTRQVVDQVRRGQPVIVESYGEEQVAILDAADYHCLRALAAWHARSPHEAPDKDPPLPPRGLDTNDLTSTLTKAGGDVQAVWDRVIAAYLDGDISLGRASQLLKISRFELQQRFNRLGIPLRLGPTDLVAAQQEAESWP